MSGTCWVIERDGMTVAVRLTPKGGRDAIEGVSTLADGQRVLKARVSAPPREGEANRALIRLLARALDVRESDLRIVAGATGRLKRIGIRGNGPALAGRLEALVDAARSG
jgi:uncharacterized protein